MHRKLFHDLRNQAASIRSGIEMLKMPELEAERDSIIAALDRQVIKLVVLIDQVEDVVREHHPAIKEAT